MIRTKFALFIICKKKHIVVKFPYSNSPKTRKEKKLKKAKTHKKAKISLQLVQKLHFL